MKTKLKVSDLIKNSCCATLLDIPKKELVKMAEDIEIHNENLISEVKILKSKNKRLFLVAVFFFLLSMVMMAVN